MADLTTYEGLKAAVEDYLGRKDLKAQIPVFIRLAENRMNRELRMRVMEHRATTEVPAGSAEVPLPWRREAGNWDVFLEMRDLVWIDPDGTATNLTYMPPDTYGSNIRTGKPGRYTIIGRDLFLLPTPDCDGKLALTYYAEVPPLGEGQPDNEVLLTAPDLYLFGALLESSAYTRGSGPMELWQAGYSDALANVQRAEQRARFTSNIKMQPIRRI